MVVRRSLLLVGVVVMLFGVGALVRFAPVSVAGDERSDPPAKAQGSSCCPGHAARPAAKKASCPADAACGEGPSCVTTTTTADAKSPHPKQGKKKQGKPMSKPDTASSDAQARKLPTSEAQWRKILSPEQYQVTRCSATEPPFSGKYWNCEKDGRYRCVCCGAELFASATKFQSGTGWPSFWKPAEDDSVKTVPDNSHGMRRIEVRCANCDAHLGHVFPDGPKPTGLRYCINSAALDLDEAKPKPEKQQGEPGTQPDEPGTQQGEPGT